MRLVTGALQFIVAGYALRLNRIFGTARVGWSLFWAFSLLALLHYIQSATPFNSGAFTGTEIEVIYALIALLLLTSMIHLETLLRERLRMEQDEKRMRDGLELLINDKTAHLTKAIGDLKMGIAERKQAEEALMTEQQLLNSLISGIPDLIYFKDRESRFTRTNEAFAREHGLSSPRETLGKTDSDFFGGQHARHAYEDEQQIMATGQPIIGKEEREDWKDGHVTWASSTKMPLRDNTGKIVGIMGISRDITRSKQAEEHIREQADLLDKSPDAIMVLDLDERLVYWNKGAERIYGWSAAEVIGKKPTEVFLNGVISPQHLETIKTVNERGEWRGELQETTKSGKSVTVQGRCNLIRDEQGNPKSRLIINTDITEKKKLESQFLRAQRMDSIGTLASGIAHDLNNVLTPLLISVQILKEKAADEDGKKLLHSLEINVQRGASLVKQVLAFGRGIEGERVLVYPAHVVREIKQIVSETFPKSVEFEFHPSADLWAIIGDPTQLHQVLLNLCINARDAMPNGGKLSIQIENVNFDETYAGMELNAKPGPYVAISVEDTGTGIPKEIRDKIFDPFFTTKPIGKGTGLGLSTTLAIVKSHGGFIHCQSEPGKGTIFKVYFPANNLPTVAEKLSVDDSKLPRGNNELVLVVDDEEPIRKLVQKMLERYGYRVVLAADGAEAVSIYRSRQKEIAVVITDIVMPIMDGTTTIAVLKKINPDVRIVTSSGLASEGGMARARNAGARCFIPKPYTAETMLNAVHETLKN
jgi:PAS domain S-box-containing protein